MLDFTFTRLFCGKVFLNCSTTRLAVSQTDFQAIVSSSIDELEWAIIWSVVIFTRMKIGMKFRDTMKMEERDPPKYTHSTSSNKSLKSSVDTWTLFISNFSLKIVGQNVYFVCTPGLLYARAQWRGMRCNNPAGIQLQQWNVKPKVHDMEGIYDVCSSQVSCHSTGNGWLEQFRKKWSARPIDMRNLYSLRLLSFISVYSSALNVPTFSWQFPMLEKRFCLHSYEERIYSFCY